MITKENDKDIFLTYICHIFSHPDQLNFIVTYVDPTDFSSASEERQNSSVLPWFLCVHNYLRLFHNREYDFHHSVFTLIRIYD